MKLWKIISILALTSFISTNIFPKSDLAAISIISIENRIKHNQTFIKAPAPIRVGDTLESTIPGNGAILQLNSGRLYLESGKMSFEQNMIKGKKGQRVAIRLEEGVFYFAGGAGENKGNASIRFGHYRLSVKEKFAAKNFVLMIEIGKNFMRFKALRHDFQILKYGKKILKATQGNSLTIKSGAKAPDIAKLSDSEIRNLENIYKKLW